MYSAEQIERYNGELDAYFERYEAYLHEYNEWVRVQGVLYAFDLYLTNEGGIQAKDIEIGLVFPPHILRLLHSRQASNAFGQPPTPPEPPEEPTPFSEKFTGLHLANLLKEGRSGYEFQLPDPFAPFVRIYDVPAALRDATGGGAALEIHLRELMHTKHIKIGSFSLAFSKQADVKNLQAMYSVLTAELPERVQGQLLFRLKEGSTQ